MKVYGDLAIRLEGMTAAECVERLSQVAAADWSRNAKMEENARVAPSDAYCFDYTPAPGTSTVRAAHLWLRVNRDGSSLSVPNIIPIGGDRLSPDEYNSVRDRFAQDVASKALGSEQIQLGKVEVAIEDVMSPPTAQALKAFSSSANKSTGASHPMDRERWFDFIIQCFEHQDRVGTDLLGDWLFEQGWDEWNARDLQIEFERETALLQRFAARK